VSNQLIPRTHNSFGDRSFSAAGPRLWNSLPPHLRQDMNFARFQRFQSTTAHRDCLLFCAIDILLLTYLHKVPIVTKLYNLVPT